MSPQQDSAKQRRAKAAEARAAQQAAEARRDRMIKIIGGLAVVLVVGAIVGGAWWASRSSSTDAGGGLPAPDPNAAAPKGVEKTGDNAWAVPLGTPKAGAPLLQVWEDFQCPACKQVEDANGAGIEELGLTGAAALYYRPTAFLDLNATIAKDNKANNAPNSSHRAIAAWGCAIDAGKTREYHNVLYQNQPEEGVGFSDTKLLEFAKASGITGDAYTTFESCFNANTYLTWSVNATQAMTDNNIGGTPTALLNGAQIETAVLADKTQLDAAVAAATKK